MLLKPDGTEVKPARRMTEEQLIPLREVSVPQHKHCGKLFSIETRARLVDNRHA